jgi:hypothetical protein
MEYKNKYIKYKNKYLTLKKQLGGNKEYFELYTINSETTLYHGSFNKVNGHINIPGYFTTDPLQSLGHLISTARRLDNSTDYKITDLNNISSCYPTIYKYKTVDKLTLLKMNVGSKKYNDSFGVLFNKGILKTFLDELKETKKFEVLTNFRNKLEDIGQKIPEKEKINITNDNFFWIYCVLFDKYIDLCKSGCFGGWVNTPGYYLLSNIDYNLYFNNILEDIIPYDSKIDGIYVERDQDEIILFNNTNLSDISIPNFILPFYINTEDKAKEFINNYDKVVLEFLDDKNNEDKQKAIINLFKKFNHIDESGINKWNFDWFKTYCENYNPYKEVDISNCTHPEFTNPEKEKCRIRFPVNIILDDEFQDPECDNFLSSKLSILNIKSHSELLSKWIDNIKTDKFSENTLQLFEDNFCINRQNILQRKL